jgi:hypothetical protein
MGCQAHPNIRVRIRRAVIRIRIRNTAIRIRIVVRPIHHRESSGEALACYMYGFYTSTVKRKRLVGMCFAFVKGFYQQSRFVNVLFVDFSAIVLPLYLATFINFIKREKFLVTYRI